MYTLIAGLVATTAGTTVAIFASTHGGDITPWATSGASAASVGGLVLVLRQVLAGKLVVRDTTESEKLLAKVVVTLAEATETMREMRRAMASANRSSATRSRRSDA